MKLVPVDALPRTARGQRCTYAAQKDLLKFLTKFIDMNVKYARVDYDKNDYVSKTSVIGSLGKACSRYELPVKSVMRDHNIYLVRTDM